MILSKNFTLEELTVTNSKLPNKPNEEQIQSLKNLVKNVLQPLRDIYGKPIKVNSGFRSFAVNKTIGGATTSQHCKGEAADLDCTDNSELFSIIREHLDFDQLIWESGDDIQPNWVHVSYKPKGNRKEVLRMKDGKYTRI